MFLDGMYQQAAMFQFNSGMIPTGSASSVAGKPPGMLALPTPYSVDGSSQGGGDSYVQMSDLEKKQRLLVEEQMIWKIGSLKRVIPGSHTRVYTRRVYPGLYLIPYPMCI